MSANSSKSSVASPFARAVSAVLGYSLWVMFAVFVVPAFLILGIDQLLKQSGVISGGILTMETALATLSLFAAQFVLGFAVIYYCPN